MIEVPQPDELLFEFLREYDRFRCELRDHGQCGVEAQFDQNEEFFTAIGWRRARWGREGVGSISDW
jgi:hypothetical protein